MASFGRGVSAGQWIFLGVTVVGLLGFLVYFFRDDVYKLASRASNRTASLTVDVGKLQGKQRNTWGHIAQGGEDMRTNMLTPVADKLKALQPQTMRIDHIYDGYDVVSREGGHLKFNWTRLDSVVKSITDAGATPMLALSYMPPSMSSSDVTGLPHSFDEWSLLVQRTVEHYSKDLQIPNMSYEVWNEPDLFGDFKTYGDKNYLTLYKASVAGAERAIGALPFEIGGPAITAYYEAWMDAFLKLAAVDKVRIDFISWHRYSTSMDDYDTDLRNIAMVVGKYRNDVSKSLKIYLTETGPDSKNNPSYDNTLGAAHVVALIATTYDKLARVYTFELVDGKDPSGAQKWGRWGLLTHPEAGMTEKPRYQALLWLNRLTGWQIPVEGQGSWVKAMATKHKADGYQFLIVNYDDYNMHSEKVPLTISGLKPGRHTLTREYFGKNKASEKVDIADSGILVTEVSLTPNQIVFLELVKSTK